MEELQKARIDLCRLLDVCKGCRIIPPQTIDKKRNHWCHTNCIQALFMRSQLKKINNLQKKFKRNRQVLKYNDIDKYL